MGTVNHVRLARLNPAIARECDDGHVHREAGHPFGPLPVVTIDPYTRRSNICSVCHTARTLATGECLC